MGLKKEQFNLRFQTAQGQFENTGACRAKFGARSRASRPSCGEKAMRQAASRGE